MTNKGQQLHLAVREGNQGEITKLLDSGVDINSMYYGWTPLQLCLNQNNESLALLLIDRGCDVHLHDKNNVAPFEEALIKGQTKVVRKMLNKGVDPNTPLSSGDPPLCVMCKRGMKDCVKELVQVGKCSLNTVNQKGESPLYIASNEGYDGILRILLEAGGDSDAIHKDTQQTPLIAAANNDHADVVKILLKHGCDVNFTDVHNKTALWYAFSNSSLDVMKLLLKSGADKNVRNLDGQTILDEAKDNDDDEVIELLTRFEKSWT
ncbi:hypothetical protein FSP39_007044 [Pinctada imbricata]|uniref:Uncharacterized protein n=1 Tax=Pinctada imbricata TaxID=66713 RepID=A0AA88YHQ1_PINIB|nr:hypothetical protein FSP39_007044 [Pinctada imbricata]